VDTQYIDTFANLFKNIYYKNKEKEKVDKIKKQEKQKQKKYKKKG